ncbi:hypothetical protein BaRGS_00004262 [Batillaria attramentaria]|uniref:Selenoprotein F n=1 Tax=Batillaria attramentaria TaxID=370345 RepID=A0ABD0LYV8_9CAEN
MADLRSLLSLFSFILVYYGECSQEFLEQCRGMGYTSNLMCSSCDELDKFNLSKLKDGCQSCCQQDSTNEAETEVQAFVKSDKPNQFPGLTVRYVRGADPVIKLMDEDRNVQQELGIDKWDTDTIEAFLRSRLQE